MWEIRAFAPTVAVFLWVTQVLAQPAPEKTSIRGDGITLSAYLFLPQGVNRKVPAIVVLHGYGNSAEKMEWAGTSLTRDGYAVLTVSMRGFGQTGGTDDCGLKQADDIVFALRWLASRPEIDPERLAIVGFSRGGHVALQTAARTNLLKAVVAYFAPADLDKMGRSYLQPTCFIGGTKSRSPIYAANRIATPVLLIHGDADTRVPAEQSMLMHGALQKAGKEVELRLVPGAQHQFTLQERQTSWPWTLSFLEKHLSSASSPSTTQKQ